MYVFIVFFKMFSGRDFANKNHAQNVKIWRRNVDLECQDIISASNV